MSYVLEVITIDDGEYRHDAETKEAMLDYIALHVDPELIGSMKITNSETGTFKTGYYTAVFALAQNNL